MAIRAYRPLTPTQRFKTLSTFSEITKSKPHHGLTEVKKRSGGRNNKGRLTSRHIGGGHKQKYRKVDFKRRKHGIAAEVVGIEYDPNRTARIALIKYADGEMSYILAPDGLTTGAKVMSGPTAPPAVGNSLPLSESRSAPPFTVSNSLPGAAARWRAAPGQPVTLNNREGDYALIKLPSGEIRRIHDACYATIGPVGNVEHMNVVSGKAGRTRWKGIRPTVRGMIMNPVDHPNGGGQGRSKGGGGRQRLPSPWGQLAKGSKPVRNASRPTTSSCRPAATRRTRTNFMGRSLKKGPFVNPKLLDENRQTQHGRHKNADQDVVAPPDGDAGLRGAHLPRSQWQTSSTVFVTENMVGHKLGEFSPTRIFKRHGPLTAKVTK